MYGNRYWWEMTEGNDLVGGITSALDAAKDDHRLHRNKMMDWMRQYNESYSTIYTNYTSSTGEDLAFRTARGTVANTYNATQTVIETLSNKLTGVKPRVKVYPSGADYTLRSEVRKLNSFLYGEFFRLELHKHVRIAFKDALICGTGLLKPFIQDKRIHFERVHPLQLTVDKMDGMYGNPRQFFQTKPVARHQLITDYPERATEIRLASSNMDYRSGIKSDQSDVIDVVEAWYTPSGKDTADGRHVILCGDVVLWDNDKYDNHHGPFVIIRWIPNQIGFWGIGVCEQIESIQLDIDETCYAIQRAQQYSKPWMFIPQTSEVPTFVIDDERDDVTVVPYKGNVKPDMKVFQMVHPEMYQHRAAQIQAAHDRVGVSELQASGRKPGGLDSGEALREYADMTSERFLSLEQDLQDFYLASSKQIVYHAELLAETEGMYTTTNPQQDVYEEIDWKDLQIGSDQYLIHAYAVSGLPTHPAGRKQAVKEMIEAGLINTEEARELLDLPDLERMRDLGESGRNVVRKTVEKILEDGDYVAPTEYDDLKFAIKHAVQSHQLGQLNGAPEENLALLSQYIDEVKSMLKEMVAKQQAAQKPEEAAPGGQPPAQG